MSEPDEKQQSTLLQELRQRVANEEPLDGENYSQEDVTLLRFLRAREWNLDAAEKQLRGAIAWRRSYNPLRAECRWCIEGPGYHSMRQVGFDLGGRPVIYSCFAQADTKNNNADDSIAHCTFLIENAKRTMAPGVTTWVFVIDCTGITLPLCNPSLGSRVVGVFSNFYPEHLERIVCVNHSSLFHGVWSAIRVFIDPKTVKKMKFIRGKEKIQRKFGQMFGDELTRWLVDEIRLNKQEPLPETQEKFWEGPMRPNQHDPRGCPSYVEQYVDPYFLRVQQLESSGGGAEAGEGGSAQLYRPHPNIADQQLGRLAPYVPRARRKEEKKKSEKKGAAGEEAAAAKSQSAASSAPTVEEMAAYGVKPVSPADLPELIDDDED